MPPVGHKTQISNAARERPFWIATAASEQFSTESTKRGFRIAQENSLVAHERAAQVAKRSTAVAATAAATAAAAAGAEHRAHRPPRNCGTTATAADYSPRIDSSARYLLARQRQSRSNPANVLYKRRYHLERLAMQRQGVAVLCIPLEATREYHQSTRKTVNKNDEENLLDRVLWQQQQ